MSLRNVAISFLAAGFLLTGCAPSYPKSGITRSVEKILRDEEHLSGKAHLVGKTLYLDIQLPELAGLKSEVPKEAMKKLEGAVLTVTRASLSSDANIQFMAVNAEIPRFNLRVHVLSRLADIKYFLYQRISKDDYEERTVIDIYPVNKASVPRVYEDISLEKFVSLLIVSQINMLTRVNPFVGSALNNAKLTLSDVANNTLSVEVSDRLTPELITLWKEIIVEKSLKIALKYGSFLPEKILLRDNSGQTFPVDLFPQLHPAGKLPVKPLKNR